MSPVSLQAFMLLAQLCDLLKRDGGRGVLVQSIGSTLSAASVHLVFGFKCRKDTPEWWGVPSWEWWEPDGIEIVWNYHRLGRKRPDPEGLLEHLEQAIAAIKGGDVTIRPTKHPKPEDPK